MKGYDKITNPYTGRKVSVSGKIGKAILNEYVSHSQSGGDATPHMGVDQDRGTACRITPRMQAHSDAVAQDRRGGPSPQGVGMETHIGIKLVDPIRARVRPKSRGTKAERDAGFQKGEPMGPHFPDRLNSQKMACMLQQSTLNKTKDQIQFVADVGAQIQPGADDPTGVSANQKRFFEDAMREGDGTGLIHFKTLKLLFRGQLFDFIMRDGLIVFQIEKPNEGGTPSRCISRVGRRLDGSISYTLNEKTGKITLNKVSLERPKCWMPKLHDLNPLSQASIGSKGYSSLLDQRDVPSAPN